MSFTRINNSWNYVNSFLIFFYNQIELNFLEKTYLYLKGSGKSVNKVILDKSRGEVSLLEQDTIENVS